MSDEEQMMADAAEAESSEHTANVVAEDFDEDDELTAKIWNNFMRKVKDVEEDKYQMNHEMVRAYRTKSMSDLKSRDSLLSSDEVNRQSLL